jgi:hypothetical protein
MDEQTGSDALFEIAADHFSGLTGQFECPAVVENKVSAISVPAPQIGPASAAGAAPSRGRIPRVEAMSAGRLTGLLFRLCKRRQQK